MAHPAPSPEEIAKELTLKMLESSTKSMFTDVLTDAEKAGQFVGTLYTKVLQSVRAANKE